MATINIVGTGGIIEGNLGTANVNVNLDKALKFDGTNDYINCGTDTDYDITADLCIAAWIKNDNSTTTSGSSEMILTKYAGTNGERCYRIYVQGTTLKFSCAGTGGTSADTYTLQYSMADILDKWNHVAGVFDQGHMYIYVNGKQKAYYDHTAEPAINVQNSRAVEIGSYEGGNNTWQGHIADVRIYNDHLLTGGAGTATSTSTHIELLASKINTDKTLGAGTTNLKGYWKLNYETATGGTAGDGGNGFVPDESGTVNQGTLTNFPTTPAYWDYDAFSVNVQDNGTTTDGNFTVTQGKVECLSMNCVKLDGSGDYVDTGTPLKSEIQTGFSISGWIKPDDGMSGTNQAIFGIYHNSNHQVLLYLDSGGGKLSARMNVDGSALVYAVEDSASFVNGANPWTHVALTVEKVDSSNATQRLYVNGVKRTLNSSNNGLMSSVDLADYLSGISEGDAKHLLLGIVATDSSREWEFAGKIRDVRFNDNVLTDNQVASLYSNTYPVTPDHWYKLDVVGQTTISDEGTGTASNASMHGNSTGFHVSDNTHTLNLDDRFTIETNGSFSAPRGVLEFSGNLDINCTNVDTTSAGNQFIHNNGKFTAKDAVDAFVAPNNATFFNFNLETTSGHDIDLRESITILGTLDLTGSSDNFVVDAANAAGNITMTMGDADNQAIIESNTADTLRFNPHATREILITGGSSLKPCRVTGQDWKWDNGAAGAAGIKLANMKFEVAVDTDTGTGNAVKIILTGDCEFDAVTVSSGDTLDLNSQRAEFGGNFSLTGTLSDTGNAGIAIFKGTYTRSGTKADLNTGTVFMIEGAGSSDYHDPVPDKFFVNAGSGTVTLGNPLEVAGSGTADVILGSGTLNANNQNITGRDDITIATGGTYTAGSGTITCKGDFTTSGGLIGKSAADFICHDDGTTNGNYINCGGATDSDSWSNITVECWVNLDHTGRQGGETTFYSHGSNAVPKFGLSGGVMRFYAGSSSKALNGNTTLTTGKWYHCAMSYNNSTGLLNLYLDGKLDGSATIDTGCITADVGVSCIGAQSTGNRHMDGRMGRISVWNHALTQTELRAMMFYDYDALEADNTNFPDATRNDCVFFYQFDEGTGDTIADKATNSTIGGQNDGAWQTHNGQGAAWAGAGTFTEGTSTLVFTGSGKTWTMGSYLGVGTQINNMTVNAPLTLKSIDNGYGAVYMTTAGTFTLGASGTLTSTDAETLYFSTAGSTIDVSANTDGLYALEALRFRHSSGNINLPELTTKSVKCEVSGGTVTSTGDLTLTTELEVNNTTTFNANGNTIACKLVDVNGGILDLRNSTLDFNQTATGDEFNLHSSSTLTTGNTTITGNTSSNTPAYLSYGGNFEVVGDVSNLELQSNADLTVIGAVTNCTFQSGVTNANIRQWHHTLDTQQLLDADEKGDDDLRLTKPALDNANELQTG